MSRTGPSRWLVLLLPPWLLALSAAAWALAVRTRLPERLVIQLDGSGAPGRDLPRDLALVLMGLFVLGELLVLSWLARLLARGMRSAPAALAGAAIILMIVAGEVGLLIELLRFNLDGTPLRWGALLLAGGIGALLPAALAVLGLGAAGERGPAAAAESIAGWDREVRVEIHRSALRFWINLPFAGGLVVGWIAAPHPVWRALVALLALLVGWALALIVAGFRYEFSEAGLRVLGLGRLLVRVPRTEVLAWEVRPVRPLLDFGGWGIRGGGSTRAFIWSGRRALRLLTTTGTIWLGHDDPDRLAAHCERWRTLFPP